MPVCIDIYFHVESQILQSDKHSLAANVLSLKIVRNMCLEGYFSLLLMKPLCYVKSKLLISHCLKVVSVCCFNLITSL
uniref:Uncharacterized protein n=1 Tax=Rhizophora mucronata TaxID=61149 RepID=A0A2P2IYT1_RHIMU